MKNHLSLLAGLLFVLWISPVRPADRFDAIKARLAEAGCVTLEFLSILESEIFDETDTIAGEAVVSADGRYVVDLGGDRYLYDLTSLYSYSAENNQVTIESVRGGGASGREISFITRLDQYYETRVISSGRAYRLIRLSPDMQNIPDSLVLTIRPDSSVLDEIQYFDVNEELNRIVFLRLETGTSCPDSLFKPAYPDSVEKVRLD
ncbi:MAG TPA: outer membrane lipoprotein carrier protein LolA [Acidobacteriota bacterium]|nr:outer membrane lipoprotein carrier protein LolA [Acidobacteriota bacterium]